MAEKFYLKGREANHGPKVSYHRSHKCVEEALLAAEKAISERGDIVWIVDEEGNMVLPADQVRLRLNYQASSLQRF